MNLPVTSETVSSPIDGQLEQIIEATAKQLQQGRPLDPEQLIAEHPEFADE